LKDDIIVDKFTGTIVTTEMQFHSCDKSAHV